MRILLLLIICLVLCKSVSAKPCQGPSPISSWGASFPQGKITNGFTYDYLNEILYVSLAVINQYYTYLNVPYSTAYGFANTHTPDQFYSQSVKPIYKYALEAENCFALRTEDGKFLVVNP